MENLLIEELAQAWDAIVIGAGPAGSVAAIQLARAGWSVLLLERCAWPRAKVCGGCINVEAQRLLQSINIALPDHPPLHSCVIRFHQRTVTVPLAGGMAVDRASLDAHLVEAARSAGVMFVDRASAHVLPMDSQRRVRLERNGLRRTFNARWVLACDGINGSSLADEPWAEWNIVPTSRIGAAITIPGESLPAGEIHMHVGHGGYVGQVRVDADTVHVAAAFDPLACRAAGSPGQLAATILDRPMLADRHWTAIGRLTRHRKQLAAPGILAVGDACGYVEPFTGQGIAWAIRGAIDASALLVTREDRAAEQWNDRYGSSVGRSQRACHAVRYSLQHPKIGAAAMAALTLWPGAWNHFTRWMA